ncbi:stalk domain-containing protein [Cellulosilyticum ruminicola]|uniref:stalk domain-containing protein n=1 Tax=Cellulosilyticum ruminicola TaxID=425254 RepID=UPI0006D1C5F2|nr:stalk domain-containing protein [Cellulosilyticum ruminicola]
MIVGSMPLSASVIDERSAENTEAMYINKIVAQTTSSSQIEVQEGKVKVFNASKLEKDNALKSDLQCGEFVLKATSEKTVTIDDNEQMSEYHQSLTKRVKLGGAGDKTFRSLAFSVEGPAYVTLYALSSGNDDRPICIYDAEGNEVARMIALGSSNISDKDKKLPAQTASLEEGGTYYIYSPKSVNLYYASIVEGETKEVTTEGIEKPEVVEIINNEVDKAKVDVTVAGKIADKVTDKLWVKLYADEKLQATQVIDSLEDGKATVSFEPGKSGEYTVVCDAIREGAKEAISSDAKTEMIKIPLGEINFTNVKTGKNASLNVDWDDVRSAVSYKVYIKEEGGADYELVEETGKSTCSILNLIPGTKYSVKVEAYNQDGEMVVKEINKILANQEERFMSAIVGSGASGYIDENPDGSVTIRAVEVGNGSGGKLADSEDGFLYYYTEIDPKTENFTLTATFHVDDSAKKDNQSGFGVMAIDSLKAGDSSARYFNSAGAMFRKYSRTVDGAVSSIMGAPGGYFVTGYTGKNTVSSSSRKTIDTVPFDWNFKKDYKTYNEDGTVKNANPPRFEDGEEYTLTLRKSNTGFHASMINNQTGEKSDEVICYEPDLLLKQEKDKYYVGICASRKITVTAKDINFTTITPEEDEPKQERPMAYKEPVFMLNSSTTSGTSDFEVGFKSNYIGKIDVLDSEGKVVAKDIAIDPTKADANAFRGVTNLKLHKGQNKFTAVYTPAVKEEQNGLLGEYEDLTSYEAIQCEFEINYKAFGTEANAIYVAPNGTSNNEGTKASPLDLFTAVNYAQPGQEIVLLGGTYNLNQTITVNRGHNGTIDKPIVLMSSPNERAVLDFKECNGVGIALAGDYWHVYDMEIKNAGGVGVHITGNSNTVEKLTVHDTGNTGVQISGSHLDDKVLWPKNNLVQSCEVYNSCDAQANDADGFAAKLTVGEGNIFRYCISHHNIDDGWDLYAKSTTGVIGEVLIEKCVAYANGKLTYGSLNGEGNGFKLGGESMPVAHVLRDSISFGNGKNGVFSNSNPSCLVNHVISFNNGGKNLEFNTNASKTTWGLNNFISYKGTQNDAINLREQSSLASTTNYLNGVNNKGDKVEDNWFTSLETVIPTIAADGSIDMGDYLKLTSYAAEGVGTIFTGNPNPTVITIGNEIGTNISGGTTGSENTNKPNSSSGSKGSGSKVSVVTSDYNKDIETAIKENKAPVFTVNADQKIALNKEAVVNLITNRLDAAFKAEKLTFTMNQTLLNEVTHKEKALTVQVTNANEADYKNVQEAFSEADALKLVGDRSVSAEIKVNTDEVVTSFTEPAIVSFDLSKVSNINPSRLTLVRYEVNKEGKVSTVKLGGSYNAETKIFTARVAKAGNYVLVEAKELLKINMTIGDKTSNVNDQSVTNDIAPQIINGSTMVPVRFIAEKLNAEVKWDSKKKQVQIYLDGQVVTVNSEDGMKIKDSRTLVPIRYISEKLGANVLWVGSSKAIEIVK